MEKHNLDRQWLFSLGATPSPFARRAEGIIVDLPHDFSIIQKRDPNAPGGPSVGYFPGGVATYEKTIFIPENWRGKKVLLEFEGVYMNAVVYFNNNIVAKHPYGYTSFHCDLTPYLFFGRENKIRVFVNNGAQPNSRWYSGSGIYRHVWLLVGESIHIPPWGVYVTTPKVSSEVSTVSVKTTVENSAQAAAQVTVRTTLLTNSGSEVARGEVEVNVPAGGSVETNQDLEVSSPNLWSVENPYLYTLRSEIIRDGVVVDKTDTKIGIRSISFDAHNGFRLNGVPIKLKGGCVHHDCGLLGAAAYDRAEERKVELLKANGFNAVRCAHNPPSPAFLDACDRLGMLVIDEIFDCWREGKNPNDYNLYFEEWWQRDLASMILRDRNHPCIIMWSIGNEIPELTGFSEGYKYARKLAGFIRRLDNTRPITSAITEYFLYQLITTDFGSERRIPDELWIEHSSKFAEPLDIVGYNYMLHRYESDRKYFPDRIICATESFPSMAFDYWEAVERLPYVIGDFVWTAIDYLGEAGIGRVKYEGEEFSFLGSYPWHQAFCGDIDICGFKRPQSYYRDCVWGISKTPYIAVHKPETYGKKPLPLLWSWPEVVSSWTWPGYEGKPMKVDVYSTNSEVELFLNGRSLGRKPAGKANRYIASFEVIYEPGELVAIGYENGVETSRTVLRTAGKPAKILLKPDRNVLKAEFGDLSFITVELVDAAGNICHNATNTVYFTAYGVGSIVAVGNGNPVSEEMYVGNQRKVHEGRAMVVVRSNGEPGEIVLTATADGIPPASVTIRVMR
ncbi:MAG: glycoside hydrolase family 2 TIM barrel-domain containing protein [Candidatus Bathyarchaeia archaeon]